MHPEVSFTWPLTWWLCCPKVGWMSWLSRSPQKPKSKFPGWFWDLLQSCGNPVAVQPKVGWVALWCSHPKIQVDCLGFPDHPKNLSLNFLASFWTSHIHGATLWLCSPKSGGWLYGPVNSHSPGGCAAQKLHECLGLPDHPKNLSPNPQLVPSPYAAIEQPGGCTAQSWATR